MAEVRSEVAFNIGVDQAIFVSRIYKKIFTSFLDGDIVEWYNNLVCMREILKPDLKPEEIKALKSKEVLIVQARQKMNTSRTKIEYNLNRNKVFDKTMDYQGDIMAFVKQCGYLPSKKDRTKMRF